MTLDTTATIADVIAVLEETQGLNIKTDLADLIGVSRDMDGYSLIVELVTANLALASKMKFNYDDYPHPPLKEMVNQLEIGKNWAKGSVTSGKTVAIFASGANTNVSFPYVDIPALPFTPSKIEVKGDFANGQQGNITVYDKEPYFPAYDITIIMTPTWFSGTSGQISSFKLGQDGFVSASGCRLPVFTGEQKYTWTAWS